MTKRKMRAVGVLRAMAAGCGVWIFGMAALPLGSKFLHDPTMENTDPKARIAHFNTIPCKNGSAKECPFVNSGVKGATSSTLEGL